MRGIRTDRGMGVLKEQRDLHLILLIAGIDLALTVYGITHNLGSEANPFFAPLTGSLAGMGLGIAFYAAVLLACSWVLSGPVRAVLGSVVFGMHVGGALTWMGPVVPAVPAVRNIFWLTLVVSASTAVFFQIMYVQNESYSS